VLSRNAAATPAVSNPYMSDAAAAQLLGLTAALMLHSNRVAHVNVSLLSVCIHASICCSLIKFFDKILSDERTSGRDATQHAAESIIYSAGHARASRGYCAPEWSIS
jgi:hypothetical protein